MFDFLVGNDFFAALLAFALVLIPAVIVHELGHLLAAKAVGITILEFGVGYPPRLFKLFRWGETEFTFNLLPLGGFVRPFGEDMIRPQSAEEVARERAKLNEVDVVEAQAPVVDSDRARLLRLGITNPRTVNEAKPLGRIFFMAAGAIANVVGAFLIFVIIGLIGAENVAGQAVYITTLDQSSVLAQAGLQPGDIIETVNGVAFDGYTGLSTALNTDQPIVLGVVRITEVAKGVQSPPTAEEAAAEPEISVEELNVTVTPGIASATEQNYTQQLVVKNYQVGSPADIGGIEPGDIMLSADGQSLVQIDAFEILKRVNEVNQGREYTLKVQRDGETVNLLVTPRVNPKPSEGFLGAGIEIVTLAGRWGLSAINGQDVMAYTPLGLGGAIQYGFNEVGSVLQQIAQMPARILSGDAEPEESRVVSIVGISQLGGVLLQGSIEGGNIYPFLRFAALISIALGITNLLPIPPLDGGRILFVLIEIVRGKPLSQRLEDAIMMTGILLMLVLGVVFIINDIRDPIINMLR